MKSQRVSMMIMLCATAISAALPSYAVAQSDAVQAARKAVVQTIEQGKKNVDDLAAKVAAVGKIVSLSVTESNDVAAKLEILKNDTDPFIEQAGTRLASLVHGYNAYAQLVQTQLRRPSVTDEQLQAIAGSLKTWREKMYDPGMQQALNLMLLKQGDEVLATAQRRLAKVKSDVGTLQHTYGAEAQVLTAHVELATKYLAKANQMYSSARDVFSADQDAFALRDLDQAPGQFKKLTLARGSAGDFTCLLPLSTDVSCTPTFKTTTGDYYLLFETDGTPLRGGQLGDLYRVTGLAVTLEPAFGEDSLRGALFVTQVNRAEPSFAPTGEEGVGNPVTASALDAVAPEADTQTVQSLIKAELDAISKAYKEFVVMTQLAKKFKAGSQ